MKTYTLMKRIEQAERMQRDWAQRTIRAAKKLDEWMREHARLLRLREVKEFGKLCSHCGLPPDRCECPSPAEMAAKLGGAR